MFGEVANYVEAMHVKRRTCSATATALICHRGRVRFTYTNSLALIRTARLITTPLPF